MKNKWKITAEEADYLYSLLIMATIEMMIVCAIYYITVVL